jgi:hypothetical protein
MQQFITAICLNPAAMPEFEVTENPNYLHLQMKAHGAREELYLSRRAIATPGTMCIDTGEFTTDAYLLHLRRAPAGELLERCFVGCGSYVRRGGQSLIESISKVNACWSMDESLDILSDTELSQLQIGADSPPRRTTWNGQPVSAKYDAHEKLVRLSRIL